MKLLPPLIPQFYPECTHLLPDSKLAFSMSLKPLIWFSLVKSRWLAMFCIILHIRVRPRFIFCVASTSIMPDSYGETVKTKNIITYKICFQTKLKHLKFASQVQRCFNAATKLLKTFVCFSEM